MLFNIWTVAILFLLFYSTAGYGNDGPPSFLVRPESKTVPVDTAIVLFCRAAGEPSPNIMWLSNGLIITDSRYKIKTLPDALSILRIDPVKLSDANRSISCTAENGIGSPVKAEATIQVLSRIDTPVGFPVIEAHPVMKSVESGRTAHLSCKVRGTPTPKLLWLKNSIPVDVRSNPRYSVSIMGNPGALMIQKATEEDQGKFECVASNEHGVVHSKAVQLFVKERQIPPYFSVKLPPVHKVLTGGTVNLTCVAVGYPMPRVFWRRQSDGLILNDPLTAPIGRNVLTVRDVRQTETYKCLAVSKHGNIGAITVIEPDGPYIPVPSPQNVRVADVNTSSVTLRWDPLQIDEQLMKIIVKFRTKFSDGPGLEMDFYDVADQNQLTIGQLQNFQHYEFVLIAETASGKRSPPTLPVEVHTAEAKLQPAPTNIQLRALRDPGSVLVEWGVPETDGEGFDVTGYRLLYTQTAEDANEDEWRQKEVRSSDPATTLTSLDSRRPVFVRIKALTSSGSESRWSETARLVTRAENVPSPPQDLEVIQYNATTYKVTWAPPKEANGQLFGYYVFQDKMLNGVPVENGRRKFAYMNKDTRSALISDFEPNTEYVIRVTAFNPQGDGEFASSNHFITGRSPPRPPRVQSVSLVDENPPLKARVEWLSALDKGDGSTAPVQQYLVWFRPVDSDDIWQLVEVDGDGREAQLDNLMLGTEYEIRMSSMNGDGYSENVTERLITPVGRPSGIPLNVQYSVSEDKVFFQWDAPEPDKRNGPIIGYHPVLSCSDNSQPRHQNVTRQWTTYTIDSKKSYGFRVAANTVKGSGPFSEQIRVRPSDTDNSDDFKSLQNDALMSFTGSEIVQSFVVLTSGNSTKEREEYRRSEDVMEDQKTTPEPEPTEPPLDPADPEYAWQVKPEDMPPILSPTICREGLLMRFEELVDKLSSGWKYHVANTDGIKDSWKHFEKYFQSVCSYTSALVGPPANVSVQALSNDSVVVQWDFDEQLNGGLADGFVVKFIHEPARNEHSSQNMDLWKAQTIMDPKARHMEVNRLTVHKPYAFCVLAIKNSRLGPCSDPPTTIEKIFPTKVVQNLRALYKTSQSVNLHWDFNDGGESRLSGQKLHFYIKQSGMKSYRTQFLKEETLNAPGFERRLDGAERTFLWSNLRPFMNYTFKVGVYSEQDGRTYWPREITVRTDPTGPPLVDTPEFVDSRSYGTAELKLKCATEEHGPISHYWLVVIPGNYSKDRVINVDSQQLVQNTNRVRQLYQQNPPSISGKNTQRRALPEEMTHDVEEGRIDLHVFANGHRLNDEEEEWVEDEIVTRAKREIGDSEWETAENEEVLVETPKTHKTHRRKRRHNIKKKREPAAAVNLPLIDGVYIGAQLTAQQVEQLQRHDQPFTLGDNKEYGGFWNMPLDPNNKYRVMSRAFALSDQGGSRFDRPFEFRAPMQEPASKLFTDSMISDAFASKPPLINRVTNRASSLWFIAPITVIFILILLVGMLIIYFLKCRRKTMGSGPFGLQNGGSGMQRRHGSITKIALGTDFAQLNGNGNGIYGPRTQLPNETSKLLVGGTHTANGTLNRSDLNNGHAHFGTPHQQQPLYDLYQPSNVVGIDPPLSISQNNLNDGPNGYQLNHHSYGTQQRYSTGRPNGGLQLSSAKFAQHLAIPLAEFPAHVEHLKQNGNELFIKEFESIETDQHCTWEHSNLEVNKPKNRYANIVAYDHSRVVLSPTTRDMNASRRRNLLDDLADELANGEEEEPGSDYINANYINGYYKERAYIATQGPLPETFADFWRMVWEEQSVVIVMLTKLEERSRVKCSQYWPSRSSATYGHISVTVLDTVELAHYTIRTMRLEHLIERETREIKHTQYTSWPDHGVPEHPTPFLMFLKKVKALNPAGAGPIITHCSAGVGRTGALIAVDCMVERIYAENTVDIYNCVKALRGQRMYMVQTEEQYIFIHDAVLDAAQSGSTEVPASKLKQHIETNIHAITQGKSTGLDVEFQSLVALRPPNATFHVATQPINIAKNRQPDQLPYDSNRVILQMQNNAEGTDFINGSWVDSYQLRRAYIATQAPMPDTVIDFWRMLWETDSCIVVMLTGKPQRMSGGGMYEPGGQLERYAEYWPLEGPLRYGQLLVELQSEFLFDAYILHEFKIVHATTNESRTVRHFQFLNWPDRSNQNIEDLNSFIQEVHTTKKQFGLDGPICVHCSNGAGRTGVFIAIATIMERIRLEQVVDVFTTVKLLRAQRPNMVETKAELELVYDAALAHLSYYYPTQTDHHSMLMR